MKKMLVKSRKPYVSSTGEKKINYLTIGTLTQFENGKLLLELNMFPDQAFPIFDEPTEYVEN